MKTTINVAEQQDTLLRDVIKHDGSVDFVTLSACTDDELGACYGAAFRRWRADSDNAVEKLREFALSDRGPDWKERMVINAAYQDMSVSAQILAQIGLFETLREGDIKLRLIEG